MGLNKPVSFSTAKLLNTKGLPGIKSFYDNKKHYELNPKKYTIAEVVMWLYKKYGIWINVNFANKNKWYFDCNRFGCDGKEKRLFQSNYDYNSPTKAYLTAIEYTLNNLI